MGQQAFSRGYNKYDIFVFLLIASLAFGGLGGALMIVRVLAILLIPSMFQKYKYCKYYLKKYLFCIILFYLFCLISIFWTPDRSQGLKELIYYPIHFCLFLEILVFSKFAKQPINTITFAWFMSAAITLIIAIWEIGTGNHLSLSSFEADDVTLNQGGIIFNRPFASVTFGNFNGYVTYLCFAMPYIFLFEERGGKIKRQILALVTILISIFVIIVDASRGGLISILLMMIIYFFMSRKSIIRTIAYGIFILLAIVNVVALGDDYFMAMLLKSEAGNLYSDQSRLEIWEEGMKILINYNGMGAGVGSIQAAMIEQLGMGKIVISHNLFVELLVQYGVVFFAMFVIYLLNNFLKIKAIHDKNLRMTLYMILLALPVYSIIDSGYLLNPIVYVAFACMSTIAYIKNINSYSKIN